MASDKRTYYKRGEAGLETLVKDLRLQLNEQLRCLDVRVDTQTAIVSELQEYFRRRAEVEMEYSRSLDKLHKSLSQRHKDLKQKRDQMHLFSSYSCWQLLMNQTRQESRDRAVLSDIYSSIITQKLARISDDLQRIYKRCRQIAADSHEELLKVLGELQVSSKTYNMYYAQFSTAENKLQYVENQRAKLEASIPKEKLEKSRKFRLVEKEILKRRNKYQDTRLKALQARNDFVLSLEAANAAVHRYFVDDLSDILDCMDVGFHTGLCRALLMNITCQESVMAGLKLGVDGMHKAISNLDSRLDKQKFIEANNNPFQLPKKFDFVPHKGDTTCKYELDPEIKEETQLRYDALCKRITSLRTSTEEVWKTMETAEKSLLEMVASDEVECRALFRKPDAPRPPETALVKLRADHQETEQFYLSKFAEYIAESNVIARLQGKYEILRAGLGEHATQLNRLSRSICEKPRRKRIGRAPPSGQPKLFGGSLEEYLELSGQEIPLIVKSGVRVINLFGLHHQGIFRVSGSQVEINNFRDSFERGEDPLADVTDASDINSVAGVLKLYLRELREPFFPTLYFDQVMEIAQLNNSEEMTSRIRELVLSLSRPVFVVMRYLFAFLNHLSEFSDENMMDPYNLAICFGPTLLPIPEDKDQVQYQNLVNELMKHIILHHEDIFPRDGGTLYEKYQSKAMDETDDIGEAPSEIASTGDDPDFEMPSEDDSVFKEREITLQIFGKSEQLEAVAQFDFTARSPRELSFKCGDVLTLYRQVSGDWWRGSFRGRDGLIPDKYIMLKIRDEDRSSVSDSGSQPRASVSSDSTAAPGVSTTPSLSTASTTSLPAASEGKRRAFRSTTITLGDPTPPHSTSTSQQQPQSAAQRPVLLHSISAAPEMPETTSLQQQQGQQLEDSLLSDTSLVSSDPDHQQPGRQDQDLTATPEDRGAVTSDVGSSSEALDCETASCAVPEDPESTGQLDQAMRQIELVTETLRAAEASDEEEATRRSPEGRSDPSPPASGGGGGDRQVTVCSAWEVRRQPPDPAAPGLTSVRSRRALWENLAAAHAARERSSRSSSRDSSLSSSSPAPPPAVRIKSQKHTPDLVMDLPTESPGLAASPSGGSELGAEEAGAAGTASPPDGATAAETFARQNQCTLKRGGHTSPSGAAGGELLVVPVRPEPPTAPAPASGQVSSFRPRARVKPQVAQKPKLSPELLKKLSDA